MRVHCHVCTPLTSRARARDRALVDGPARPVRSFVACHFLHSSLCRDAHRPVNAWP